MVRSLADNIDRLSDRIGQGVSWVCLFMVLIGAFNAMARYLGRFIGVNLSSNTYIELQWYAFSAVFLLTAGYVLRRDAHVRVDVIYGRLPVHARRWIDLLGSVFFLIPFCVMMMVVSLPPAFRSFYRPGEGWEMSPDPGGLIRFPAKIMIPLAFLLLFIQAIAHIIKQWQALKQGQEADS